MKRFLLKVVGLLVAVLVLTLAINRVYFALDRYPIDHTGKFAEVPDSIQVANLGSSHGLYGFNYDELEEQGITCFNFSLLEQSPEYDYRLLKYYKDRIAPGATVFVCVSGFALFGSSEIYLDYFESMNRRYYRFLPDELVREYDPLVDLSVTVFPAFDSGIGGLVEVFRGYYLSYDRKRESNWSKKIDEANLVEDVRYTYTKFLVTGKQNDDGSMIVNQEAIDALYKIIDLVRDIGAEPVLVTTPLVREYNEAVEKNVPRYNEYFYGIVGDIVSATGVRYFDHSHDERFVDNHDLFMDADHLSKTGAKLFTAILYDEAINHRQSQ